MAERFVQTFKRALQAREQSGRPFNQRLVNFLFSYRSTPHSTTNRTPSSLFLKRELRTRLDLLRPDNSTKVEEKQATQKLDHDSHAKLREYKIGDNVIARNYHSGPKWEPAVVVERKGPLSYTVQLDSGLIWRRHIDQLRDGVSVTSQEEVDMPMGSDRSQKIEQEPEQVMPDNTESTDLEPAHTTESNGTPDQTATQVESELAKTYPRRLRQQPDRYM